MGRIITINSASMVNKGLEMIEAQLLFGIPIDRIAITVHPQSAVHSMVEYSDGSVIAQCSITDMKLPLALALDWPKRQPGAVAPIDWTQSHSWEFEPIDEEVFKAIPLAREVALRGLTFPLSITLPMSRPSRRSWQGKLALSRSSASSTK